MNPHHKRAIRKKIRRQLGWTAIIKNRWVFCGDVWKNFPDLCSSLIGVHPMSGPTGTVYYLNYITP